MKAISNEKKEEVRMLRSQGKTHWLIATISGVSVGSYYVFPCAYWRFWFLYV